MTDRIIRKEVISVMAKSKPESTTEIVVLSVRQPWAAALLEAGKWCECRTWRYPTKYRGPLFIHSSSSWAARPHPDIMAGEPWMKKLWDSPSPLASITGAIIGRVDVVHAADEHDTEECYRILAKQSRRVPTPTQVALMPFLPPVDDSVERKDDPWRWWGSGGVIVCRNPVVLNEPISTGGKLNLWRFAVDPERLVFREKKPSKRKKR